MKESVYEFGTKIVKTEQPKGRFPANFIHDGSDEVVSLFLNHQQRGIDRKECFKTKKGGDSHIGWHSDRSKSEYSDSGSAARLYCAKASKEERNAGLEHLADVERTDYGGFHSEEGLINNGRNPDRLPMKPHPTVKPVDLMKYLCRLITPPGVVSSVMFGDDSSATAEGFSFIGIEREEEYINVARHRISHWVEEKEEQVRQQRAQKSLFDW